MNKYWNKKLSMPQLLVKWALSLMNTFSLEEKNFNHSVGSMDSRFRLPVVYLLASAGAHTWG